MLNISYGYVVVHLQLMLAMLIVLFGVSYVVLYWRIVRFKAPRWLVFRR